MRKREKILAVVMVILLLGTEFAYAGASDWLNRHFYQPAVRGYQAEFEAGRTIVRAGKAAVHYVNRDNGNRITGAIGLVVGGIPGGIVALAGKRTTEIKVGGQTIGSRVVNFMKNNFWGSGGTFVRITRHSDNNTPPVTPQFPGNWTR